MTDTILTIKQLEDAFVSLTLQILGLDPTSNPSRVRVDWPEYGAPGWGIDDDVTFLMVTPDDDPITRQFETQYSQVDSDNANEAVSTTSVIRVNWVCYGPNSFDDARTIRAGLFSSPSKDALTANNLSLILDVPAPMRAPEPFNNQWWDRSSFSARFNELVVRNSTVPYIQTSNVQIVKG